MFFDNHEEENSKEDKDQIITEEKIDSIQPQSHSIIKNHFGAAAAMELDVVVRSKEFDELFFYSRNDLGNVYTNDHTAFRLWAPTASEARLVTYEKWNDRTGIEIAMKQGEKGTWFAELPGDQDGLIYTYKVNIEDNWNEAVDPYVRAVTVNGDKGVVVNLSTTNPKTWRYKKPPFSKLEDAIIYELHIRDFSIFPNSGIKNKGKYLGVAEMGTTGLKGVKTGLSYLKDLGVTHIQFLPMFDYCTVDETQLDIAQYNWGYDPKNYNVPEGSYSTDPYDPKVRIKEMKQMIQSLHDQGLRVIMDVVYNHVFAVNESNFNAFVPGYYFRYNEDGTLANGTGVGNDTASERKMMRKFIVDSVTYWATEYQIDGFRFDLMGIHDVETMNAVRIALDKIDPTIIVLGEGWELHTPLDPKQKANQKNADQMPGIAHFNDGIRDGLKGSVFVDTNKGFINGEQGLETTIKRGIVGQFGMGETVNVEPSQVVTYAEAHDNHTIWDRLKITNAEATDAVLTQMHKLASSIVLTSQGIAFIHAGQEFMRTKGGDHNSYKSPDSVNQLDWSRRIKYNKEVQYIKGLIELRKKYTAFRMSTAADVRKYLKFIEAPKNIVAYTLTNPDHHQKNYKLVIIHNANHEAVIVNIPENGIWHVLVNGKQAGTKIITTIKGSSLTVPALSTFVLKKEYKPLNLYKKRR